MLAIGMIVLACVLALASAVMVYGKAQQQRRSRQAAGAAGENRVGDLLDLYGGHDRLDNIVLRAGC